MNTNTDRDTTRVTGWVRARHAATLSVAGVLAGLALAPTSALADHPTSGGGESVTPSGDKWSYMYDVAQRREAMARVQDTNATQARSHTSDAAGGYGNPWSYMYDADQGAKQKSSRWLATGSRPRRRATTPFRSARRTLPWPTSWCR